VCIGFQSRVDRVEKRGLGWAVENESSNFGGTSAGFETKEEALRDARRKRNSSGGVIIVEREDGSIQKRIG